MAPSRSIDRPIPPAIHVKLKLFPFTPVRLGPDRRQHETQAATPANRREVIRARLRSNMKLPDSDKEFLREHPEETQVLRVDMAPQFVRKIDEALCAAGEGPAGGGIVGAGATPSRAV